MPAWLVLLLWLTPALAPAPPVERAREAPRVRPDAVVRYAIEYDGARPGRFRAIAAAVLADPRGWSLGGRIRFRRVSRGADFVLHLAAPAELPALGCWDRRWSCRSGDRVVINAARWRGGATAWRGSLRDYRRMLLNHEVGHWLGFGHAGCVAAGARAPVMMQQSMGTGACRENPWPLAAERRAVRARLVGP